MLARTGSKDEQAPQLRVSLASATSFGHTAWRDYFGTCARGMSTASARPSELGSQFLANLGL